MRPKFAAAGLLLAATICNAQLMPVDPDWREAEVPAPPALNLDGLVPLEMPASSLRFGVAPASVAVGDDGIVRYVIVALSSSGAVNAMYEGIRCNTGEFKVYARHSPDRGWMRTNEPAWQSVFEQAGTRHALLVARSGACEGHAVNGTAPQIVRDLRLGKR